MMRLPSDCRPAGVVLLGIAASLTSATVALAEPAQGTSKQDLLWVFLLIVGLVLLIAGPIGGWFIYTGRKGLALAEASRSWPTTPGNVIESRVEEISRRAGKGGRSTTYRPIVRYEYTVAGVRHEADVIQFGMTEQGTLMKADAFVLERPVEAACTVHYNPDDPKIATLDTSAQSARGRIMAGWGALIGAPVITALIIGLIFWLM